MYVIGRIVVSIVLVPEKQNIKARLQSKTTECAKTERCHFYTNNKEISYFPIYSSFFRGADLKTN